MNQPTFYQLPIKVIIDMDEALKNFTVSVAFKTKKDFWSVKFRNYEQYPTQTEINQTIKNGHSFEQTGAVEKFGVKVLTFEKSFN